MFDSPEFLIAAIPAVLIVGIAKGGFGGGAGIVGVPLLALVVSPAEAAAILLPILVAMDLVALRSWYGRWDVTNLRTILPGAVIGVACGWGTFHLLSGDALRVLIGVVALIFVGQRLWPNADRRPRQPSATAGTVYSALSGFTSFGIHAGAPPLNLYLLPQCLEKSVFQATVVVFFTFVNLIKLPPYYLLGQLDPSNLMVSLLLTPLAPLGVFIGVRLHHQVSDRWFFIVIYTSLTLIALKLLHDGVHGLLT